ncbi:Uncharacterised protein [uncultured archaeon]|nr:Uncharacterised protein [uncultured archaeon]
MLSNEYIKQLEEALQKFDLASTNLALHQTLESATQANIESLRWAYLLYDHNNGGVPKNLIDNYLRDIGNCVGVLTRMKDRSLDYEKQTMSPEDFKKIRRASSHIGSYIDQMSQRTRLVAELSEERSSRSN